jgi:hypothetical protein
MSQAEIGNLKVRLGIDTAQFANGVKQAQGTLARLEGSLKTLAIGAAAGAASALAGLSAAVNKSLGRMDALGKAAQKVGIPVDEFSKLEYAAKLSDVSLESLTTTLARFSRSLSEISAGEQNDAGAALQAIGVAATDAQGKLRPTTAILEDVAEKFSGMRDGANKTALAIALFGRAGADMIPMLNGGRDAIRNAGDELERFGGVVGPEAAKRAEQFNDNLTRMQKAAEGLGQQVTEKLLSPLISLTERLLELFDTSTSAKDWFTGLYREFEKLDPRIATTRKEIEAIIGALERLGIIEGMVSLKSDFPGVMPGQGKLKASKGDVDALLGSVETFGGTEAPALPPKDKDKPKKLVEPGTIEDIYGAGKAVQSLEVAFQEAQWGAGAFSDSLLSIGDSIQNSLSGALSGLITGTMSVQEAFASMVQSIVQSLADLAAELLTNVAFKFLLQALGGGGGAGFNFGGMAFGGIYGDGGYLGSGKWGIAGESGPEIIHGPARITPMDKAGGGGSMNVTVINNTPARVNTRRGADGGLTIEVVEEMMASAMSRGGNKIDDALARGYGLRRAGR